MQRSGKASSRDGPAAPATSRARNSERTEKSKPGSVSSRSRASSRSIRARTASTAWRSESPSANGITVSSASRLGASPCRPRAANGGAKPRSSQGAPGASRIRMERLPLGNAARATRAVSSGTGPAASGCRDTGRSFRLGAGDRPRIPPRRRRALNNRPASRAHFANGNVTRDLYRFV